jgi:hypothetical protein
MYGLRDAEEDFSPYFLVGGPSDPTLAPAFERAISFLADAPGKHPPRIIREEDIPGFVDEIEHAAKAHAAID